MRIQSRDRRDDGTERIELVPGSLDDLWHLQYVLEPGDRVEGDTTRRIQRDDEQLRDTGGEREHMYVTLEVDTVEFHKFANRLRIGGVIVDCSREDQLGHHHTLNVEERKEIAVTKNFKTDQLERLQEAVEATENPDVAIATVEEAQAHVHTVAQYGVDEYASITGPTGKGEYAQSRGKLFSELADTLGRLEVDAVVLAGPGFTKEDAFDYLQDEVPGVAEKVSVVDTAAVGDRGVHEVLKRGAVEEVQQETRIAREAEYIDELTAQIAGEGKAAYGPENVKQAAEYGAVERLLVLDEWLRNARASTAKASTTDVDGDRGSPVEPGTGTAVQEEEPADSNEQPVIDVDEVIRSVEQQGGDVTVFSGEFAPGQQLRNLGGIAALLRYRIE
jgi:protein pelota